MGEPFLSAAFKSSRLLGRSAGAFLLNDIYGCEALQNKYHFTKDSHDRQTF